MFIVKEVRQKPMRGACADSSIQPIYNTFKSFSGGISFTGQNGQRDLNLSDQFLQSWSGKYRLLETLRRECV